MTNTDVLRLVLIIGENDNETFNKNLLKYIEAVMFEEGLADYSVEQIIAFIKDSFHMEFTEQEILAAIASKKGRKAPVIQKPKTRRYFLTPQRIQALKDRNTVEKLDNYIQQFVDLNQYSFSLDAAKTILYEFFLSTINENIKVLLELCNRNVDRTFHVNDESLPNEHRAFINDFLNWDNDEKNKYIYYIISFCWDYCKLTLKKDNSSFRNIFRNKVFFLDSNVIFRLYGINNVERQKVIEAFIGKCENAGIELKYTNFTYNEIFESIERNIAAVSHLTQGKKPLKSSTYKKFISANTDFLDIYCSWCEENNCSDISKFKQSLTSGMQTLLRRFTRYDAIDYSQVQLDTRYSTLSQSLYEYKTSNYSSNTHPKSVSFDVNNWINVGDMRKAEKGTDILSIHNFIISADGNYCNWSSELMPGAIPLIVKPSVWHSILLKLNSRSDDDFKSFISFLNLRLSENPQKQDSRRPEVLVEVLERNYEPELSDMVLNYIDSRLITVYKDADDIKSLVDDAGEKVISAIEASAIAGVEGKIREDAFTKGLSEGESQAYEKIAKHKATKRMLQYDTFRKLRTLFFILFTVATIIALAYITYHGQLQGFLFWINNNAYSWTAAHWIALINLLLTLLTIPVKSFIDFYFENGDENKLQERFRRNLLKSNNK